MVYLLFVSHDIYQNFDQLSERVEPARLRHEDNGIPVQSLCTVFTLRGSPRPQQ